MTKTYAQAVVLYRMLGLFSGSTTWKTRLSNVFAEHPETTFIRGACVAGFRLCVRNGGGAPPQYARPVELPRKCRSTDALSGPGWKADGLPTIFAAFQTNRRTARELDTRKSQSIRSCSV